MKRTKSIVALVLAVVLVFALSASAFATNTVTVSVYWENVLDYTTTVSTSEIAALCGNNAHLYALPQGNVTYPSTYTAADALIASYLKNYNYSSYTSDEIDYAWYQTNYPSTPAHYGLYIDCFEGLRYDTVGTYYQLGDPVWNVEREAWVYTYYWVGDGWSLKINNQTAAYYASEYDFDTISSITFTYMPIQSDNFESTTVIPNAIYVPVNP